MNRSNRTRAEGPLPPLRPVLVNRPAWAVPLLRQAGMTFPAIAAATGLDVRTLHLRETSGLLAIRAERRRREATIVTNGVRRPAVVVWIEGDGDR